MYDMEAINAALAGDDPVRKAIVEEGMSVISLLLEKNAAYGNSALDPVRIFAKSGTPEDQLYVRVDDKLSRIMRGQAYPGDNDLLDLVGYLVLILAGRSISAGE